MITYVTLGSNDRRAAKEFYDAALAPLGLKPGYSDDEMVGYGPDGGETQLWVVAPFNGLDATAGNGSIVRYSANSERRNALSLELFSAMGDQLDAWRTDDDVAVVLLTGGEEVFCAGLDLDLQSGFDQGTRKSYGEACLRVYGTLLDYPKPTIAAVAGPTLGGGCDIAIFSPFVYRPVTTPWPSTDTPEKSPDA